MIEPHVDGLTSSNFAVHIEAEASAMANETKSAVALVVIDTLGACFGDESQDDARPASKVTGTIDRIGRRLGCPVLTLHHTGKAGSSMRGSQVFFDRADAVIKASRDRGMTTFLTVEKLRSGPGGARFGFTIDAIDVQTSDGSISVQVVRDLRALEAVAVESAEDQKVRRRQTDADVALGILHRIAKNGTASNDAWQTACYEMWAGRTVNALRAAFSKARAKLKSDGQVSIDGDVVAVPLPQMLPQPLR